MQKKKKKKKNKIKKQKNIAGKSLSNKCELFE